MTYLDRTFCISPNCSNKCNRQLTKEISDAAEQAGEYLSVAAYCGVLKHDKDLTKPKGD